MGLFGHKNQINVPLTFDVIKECKCATCPVQANSACAKPKIAARNDMLTNPEKMMQQFMSPGMMQNLEMLKNMNPDQLRGMSREQMQSLSDQMMKNTPKEQTEAMKPKMEDMPGPYCANGVAVCKDFDFGKACICDSCQVFKDFSLAKGKPVLYYCRDGKP
jgi:hypothetical protein